MYICVYKRIGTMKPKIELDENEGNFVLNSSLENYDLFKRVVRVFSSSFLDESFFLTDRELELLYCITQFKKHGDGNVFSKTNINKFFPSFGSKRLLQVWLPKLQKKFWITFDKNTISFRQEKILDFLSKDNINFSISFKNNVSG